MSKVRVEVSTTLAGPYMVQTLAIYGIGELGHINHESVKKLAQVHIQRLLDSWNDGELKGLVQAHVGIRHQAGEPHLCGWINTSPELFDSVKDALFSRAAQESGVEHLLGNHMPA